MSGHTIVRIVVLAVMAWQGYQFGLEHGQALKAWAQSQEASSTLRISRP